MIRLFQFLLTGCWHRWQIIQKGKHTNYSSDLEVQEVFNRYTLQCRRCGALKKQDLR